MFKVVVIVGASGSGKTELQTIAKRYKCNIVLGCKTRPYRKGENKTHYNRVSTEWFLSEHKKGNILSATIYNGSLIGSHKKEFDMSGINVMLSIPDNIRLLKRHIKPKNLVLIWIDATEEQRIERMKARGDSDEDIAARIKVDRKLFKNAFHLTDYKITSSTKKEDAEELISILDELREE